MTMAIARPEPRKQRAHYVLVLEPLPHVDAIRNLRWVLKRLIRQFGFRCLSVEEKATPSSNVEDKEHA